MKALSADQLMAGHMVQQNVMLKPQRVGPELKVQISRPHFTADPAPAPDWAVLDGVVFTGAGVSWAADMAAARPAQKLMEQAFSFGLPVFGSCYGMQLGVAVLGGRMQANPAG